MDPFPKPGQHDLDDDPIFRLVDPDIERALNEDEEIVRETHARVEARSRRPGEDVKRLAPFRYEFLAAKRRRARRAG